MNKVKAMQFTNKKNNFKGFLSFIFIYNTFNFVIEIKK